MDDPDSVDVDATTSASVLMPGNVGLLAQWIQEETGGDLFPIITEEPYSSDYDTCLNRAIEEHDSGSRPAITGYVDHIEDYDIAFLGFPNWWYIEPMAIRTFLEEYDFTGKTVIPFCTTLGAGISESEENIASLASGATVLEGITLRTGRQDMSEDISSWLAEIGMSN